jgi:hypothetical protein
VIKVASTDFGTRSKVLMMVCLAFKTFNLVPQSVPTTFDLVPKYLVLDQMIIRDFQSSENSPKI